MLCGAKLVERQIMEDFGLIARADNRATIFLHYFLFAACLFLLIYFAANLL